MTKNQIEYQKMLVGKEIDTFNAQEAKRHNLAQEEQKINELKEQRLHNRIGEVAGLISGLGSVGSATGRIVSSIGGLIK